MSKIVKLKRYENNPILQGRPGVSWDATGAFNPGAVMDDNGRIHIFYRASSDTPKKPGVRFGVSTIGHAISDDGFTISERPEDGPVIDLSFAKSDRIWGIHGIEDPRVTKIDDTYYFVCAATSWNGDYLVLSSTKDFKTYKEHGLVLETMSQRTAGLFPEKINGKYVMIHRVTPNIWISQSSNLKSWDGPVMILDNQKLPWFAEKIGMSCPPIKTEKAWAVIFHGKDRNRVYRLGIFWLDLEDPTKLLHLQDEPILEPEAPYETSGGITGDCVYACGAVVKNGTVFVYYGAGDSTGCVATMPQEMLELPI